MERFYFFVLCETCLSLQHIGLVFHRQAPLRKQLISGKYCAVLYFLMRQHFHNPCFCAPGNYMENFVRIKILNMNKGAKARINLTVDS